MPDFHFSAIILAAGYSSRMGRFKPLLPIDGRPAVERLVRIFKKNRVDDILVVTGHRGQDIDQALKHTGVQIVENPEFDQGMFSSVKAGVQQIGKETDAFFVIPADIPLVRPLTIDLVKSTYHLHTGHIIYPCFKSRRGHPPLIPAQLIPAILSSQKDGGLRAVLENKACLSKDIDVPDRHILMDMDHPKDYTAALACFDTYEIPDPDECHIILTRIHPVSTKIADHCQKVADVADNIAQKLLAADHLVNTGLIRAAALLHDIARDQKNHARAGAALIKNMGFHRVADIISGHMDLPDPVPEKIKEKEIVYLADKCVTGSRIVLPEQRFKSALDRFGHDPDAKKEISRRKKKALEIKQQVEKIVNMPFEDIILPGETS